MKRIFMLIATLFILSATTIIVLASGAFNGEGEPPETTFVRTTPAPATSDAPTATYIPLRELVPEAPETSEETEPARPKYRDDIVSEGRLLAYDLQEIMQDYCEQYGVPYMTKSYVETEIRAHFEVENLTHEGLTRTWNFDGETYTAVPGGVKDRPLARLDSVIRVNLGEEPQYCVQYCLLGNGNLLDDAEWSRCRDAIVSGDAPDLSELRKFTLVFTMQDGEPVFLSHAELSIDEPPFTPLPNDGRYDVTQPLQDWELTRTNGVQTGMTQAQVEKITGQLVPDEAGVSLLDSQNVSYRFWQSGYRTPQLMELHWNGTVENDEIVCKTAQDAPAFRGICLGDTIDEVFDKFPCVDRELKQWAAQYVYGYEGADNSAVLSFIADSFYALTFTVNGQRRAVISFSRVQQRVFEITIYAETYWQDANEQGAA